MRGLNHDKIKIVLRLRVFQRRLGFFEKQRGELFALILGQDDRALEGLNGQVDFGLVDELVALGLIELVAGPLFGREGVFENFAENRAITEQAGLPLLLQRGDGLEDFAYFVLFLTGILVLLLVLL